MKEGMKILGRFGKDVVCYDPEMFEKSELLHLLSEKVSEFLKEYFKDEIEAETISLGNIETFVGEDGR